MQIFPHIFFSFNNWFGRRLRYFWLECKLRINTGFFLYLLLELTSFILFALFQKQLNPLDALNLSSHFVFYLWCKFELLALTTDALRFNLTYFVLPVLIKPERPCLELLKLLLCQLHILHFYRQVLYHTEVKPNVISCSRLLALINNTFNLAPKF